MLAGFYLFGDSVVTRIVWCDKGVACLVKLVFMRHYEIELSVADSDKVLWCGLFIGT